MRKAIITITLTMSALLAMAQEASRDRYVNLELFGPSNMVGLSYDVRFKPGSNWGYRTGVGYDPKILPYLSVGYAF